MSSIRHKLSTRSTRPSPCSPSLGGLFQEHSQNMRHTHRHMHRCHTISHSLPLQSVRTRARAAAEGSAPCLPRRSGSTSGSPGRISLRAVPCASPPQRRRHTRRQRLSAFCAHHTPFRLRVHARRTQKLQFQTAINAYITTVHRRG